MTCRRLTLAIVVLAPLLVLLGAAGSAAGYPVQYCSQIPIVGGIPPWGFHTGSRAPRTRGAEWGRPVL